VSALSLAHPAVFVVALALIAVAHVLGGRRRDGRVAWFPFPRWLAGLPSGSRQRAAPWFDRARLLLLAGLALGVAGPRSRFEERRDVRRGVDLFVLLDASSSMTVTLPGSYAATRFASARESAGAFVTGRPADRVGLATFARWPRLFCPLTADHELFAARLAAARPVDAGSEEDRTAIGVALAEAVEQLGPKGERERVVVLVTDGANNLGPIEPDAGARLCRDRSIRVYTIAIGGGEPFGSGAAPVDTRLLDSIASATGGRSFSARDASQMRDAWQSIDALEQAPLRVTLEAREAPLAAPFVGWIALAGLLLVTWQRTFARVLP
jgi:Ca-activated chloride channel family protein